MKTQKPDIWLQDEEMEGRAACGCVLCGTGPEGQPGPAFYFCALHAARREAGITCPGCGNPAHSKAGEWCSGPVDGTMEDIGA